MKRLFFMAAMTSVALSGCVSEMEDIGTLEESKNLITFTSPVVSPNTRTVSGEMTNPYNKDEFFNVYAVWTLENFATWKAGKLYMNNVKCKHVPSSGSLPNNNTFMPETDYYWPKNGKLTFAAYSPSDATGEKTYGANGLKIENFKVSLKGIKKPGKGTDLATHIAQQYDLMYTNRVMNKTQSMNNTEHGANYDGINLHFKHALSSVQFTVKTQADYGDTQIKLKNIVLSNIVINGNFEEGITSETIPSTAPKWTKATDEEEKRDFTVYDHKGELVSSTETKLIDFGKAQAGNEFIMIPQAFLDESAKITITWSIKSPTGDEIEQTTVRNLKDILFKDSHSDNKPDWEIGRRYTYNIVFALDKIYFNPTVEEWKDATGGDVTI